MHEWQDRPYATVPQPAAGQGLVVYFVNTVIAEQKAKAELMIYDSQT